MCLQGTHHVISGDPKEHPLELRGDRKGQICTLAGDLATASSLLKEFSLKSAGLEGCPELSERQFS